MASLGKRGNIWYVIWRDASGCVRRQSTGCKDKTAAQKAFKKIERELAMERTNPFTKWRRVPLQEHVDTYRNFQLARGTTATQANLVHARVSRILAETGIKWMEDVTVSKIVTAIDGFRKQAPSPKRKKETYPTLSNQTKCFYAKAMKQITAWMFREGRIDSDPLVNFPMWNVRVDPKHPRRVLTDSEIVRLDDVAETSLTTVEGLSGPERAFIYRMAVATGLRRRELASLTSASFKFDDPPRVTVEASHSKHREQDIVFIRSDLVEPLKERVRLLPPGASLFPLLAQRKTSKMMKFDLKAAAIPYKDQHGKYADFHSLRHRFVTKAWDTGEAAPTVMALARHKDLKTTLRYTHADTSAQLRAIQAMKPPLGNLE